MKHNRSIFIDHQCLCLIRNLHFLFIRKRIAIPINLHLFSMICWNVHCKAVIFGIVRVTASSVIVEAVFAFVVVAVGFSCFLFHWPSSAHGFPAFSHSPYWKACVSSCLGLSQDLTSCPINPQWKQKLTNLSYLNVTHTISPLGLLIWLPWRRGLSNGISTWIRRNLAWSEFKPLQSTSMTRPNSKPMSCPTSLKKRSNGSPHSWTHIRQWVKEIFPIVKPCSHLRKSKTWLSKHYGLLWITHCNWLSMVNLNCNNPSPTSIIFKSAPNFQLFRSKFLAALKLVCLVVKNLPKRLSKHSSRIFSLWVGRTCITRPSLDVNLTFCKRSITSWSMKTESSSKEKEKKLLLEQ